MGAGRRTSDEVCVEQEDGEVMGWREGKGVRSLDLLGSILDIIHFC